LKGISPKTLSERLKELQRFGVINKESFAEIPPRVQYSLTPKGKELVGTFKNLDSFMNKWED
jgi:DNA-binding HxlR family transcriptional regulator